MNGANDKVKFLLNWNHFSDHVSNCMAKLMTDSSYSDVIIATGDKRMIYAHRFVLANSSKYFQRLLKQMNKQRGVQLVVALPEVKYEIFKILMNYMYRGESQVPHELLPLVIKAGRVLEINGLIDLHDADGSAKGASLWKCNKEETQCARSAGHASNARQQDNKKGDQTQCGQEKSRNRGAGFVSDSKTKKTCQNIDIDSTSEPSVNHKNGMVRSYRTVVPNNEGGSEPRKKDSIKLVKRKASGRDAEKEAPSSSTEHPVPKKSSTRKEAPVVDAKRVKIDESSWGDDNPVEEITIKTELPFETDDVNYNELLCDYCNETYTNPSDWVRHMTDHHGDHGFQSFDMDKEKTNDNIYTCIICSTVLMSAVEWARHLRFWHSDTELAVANKVAQRAKKASSSKGSSSKE